MSTKKRGPLSMAEIFYIDSHVAIKDADVIAEELNRNTETIVKHIKTLPPAVIEPEPEPEPEVETSEDPPMVKTGDLIKNVTETGDDSWGIAIMTKEASERGDESRKRVKKDPASIKGVFVMNDKKPCK
jgi:hypothetical protein